VDITSISSFIDYYERIRKRTLRVIRCIPEDKFDWTYKEGEFTLGDMIRHIASIQRYMFAENVQFKPSIYPGHHKELIDDYESITDYLDTMYKESMVIFGKLTNEDLHKKCITPAGTPITVWKWLRAMVEHEIHHRGQIYLYLNLLGIATPPLYGLTSEEVRDKSS
jgi:uncharacterized damage-inducible protein DinB